MALNCSSKDKSQACLQSMSQGLSIQQEKKEAWNYLPGRIPTNWPYWRGRAPWPLYFHFLITIFVPDADNAIEHAQSKVLAIICPAEKTHMYWRVNYYKQAAGRHDGTQQTHTGMGN